MRGKPVNTNPVKAGPDQEDEWAPLERVGLADPPPPPPRKRRRWVVWLVELVAGSIAALLLAVALIMVRTPARAD